MSIDIAEIRRAEALRVGQSRRWSAIESVANVAVGYGVAVAAQCLIFPWFGVNIPLADNLLIGVLFTVISLVRSYTLRRVFNNLHRRRH